MSKLYEFFSFFNPFKNKSLFKVGDLIAVKPWDGMESWEIKDHKRVRTVYRVLDVGKKKYRIEPLRRKEEKVDPNQLVGLNTWLRAVEGPTSPPKYEINRNYELIPESQFNNDLWELSNES